jgi:two-component system sensor histidine kinase HydH
MKPSLVAKLTAPLAIVSILMLVIAIGAAAYIRNLQKSVSLLLSNNVESMMAAQELEISIRDVRLQFDRYLSSGNKEHLDSMKHLRDRTDKALNDAEALAITTREKEIMKRTRKGYDHFFAEYDKVLKDPPPQGFYPKLVQLIDTVLTNDILAPAHEFLKVNEGVLTRTSRENEEFSERLTLWLVGLGLLGALSGLIGGWAIAVAVSRSIQRTEEQLRTTAQQLNEVVRPEASALSGALKGRSDPMEEVTVSVSAVLKRLRQTERDALRAEQLAWVGQMAAGVAHEIRNPLMAIKLLIQAAADRGDSPSLRPRDFQVLDEEIVRLEQIVSGFLDFARPPHPEKRPTDLQTLIHSTVDGIQARAELQGVDIKLDLPPSTLNVHADPNQMRQVLYNLLFNALDAQPQGGEIRISLESRLSESPEVLLTVSDQGPGLPAELGDQIFEPFVSTKDSGIGLGLSICRRIIESHQGVLMADDRPTSGAIFLIRLPLHSSERFAALPHSPSLTRG